MKCFLVLFAMLAATPAMAGEKLVSLDDANTYFASGLGKQVTAVFSGNLVSKYFGKAEFPGVVLSELNDSQACFFVAKSGLIPMMPS
jgi:hypothetical protein